MEKPIKKHIFELLKHHDCVIITGLGGFILNRKPAYVNHITNTIYPPSKSISFNSSLIQNDGLLAQYIARKEKISYEEACLEIMKFSRKTKLKLQKKKDVVFDNIGFIQNNNSNKIEFTPNHEFNFDPHSYGLKSFQIRKIDADGKQHTQSFSSVAAAIILLLFISVFSLTSNSIQHLTLFNLNPIKTNNYHPRSDAITDEDSLGRETPGIYNVKVSQVDFDLYKINGTDYHVATKKCFKLGFARDVQIKIWQDEKNRTQRQLCFLNMTETEYDDCYKITNVYNELTSSSDKVMVLTKRGRMKEAMLVLEETYIDPYVIANSTPDDLSNTETELESENIGERFMNAIQSLNTPQNQNDDNSIIIQSIETPTITKNIHIIVGSFSEIKNAKAYSTQLINRGFPNTSIIGQNENGLIRVSVDSFYTEEEADLVLSNIRKKLSSAWVLNSNNKP